ncbi:hypothetical protein BD626DRAFT_472736 [Schizophyllum amplum]|uniref:Uncharacterized protein n=1 Tax=Schizophyllum amplum TaxID=97359 RepID=A0A550CW94_9AGAR|nr:hypothetical protein BD626DRAFT_472736 [Auriculariopsis ampla]
MHTSHAGPLVGIVEFMRAALWLSATLGGDPVEGQRFKRRQRRTSFSSIMRTDDSFECIRSFISIASSYIGCLQLASAKVERRVLRRK